MSDRNLLLSEIDCIRESHRILNDYHNGLIKKEVEDYINYHVLRGYVITVEQRPLEPLAMGNYEHVVSVRRKVKR